MNFPFFHPRLKEEEEKREEIFSCGFPSLGDERTVLCAVSRVEHQQPRDKDYQAFQCIKEKLFYKEEEEFL